MLNGAAEVNRYRDVVARSLATEGGHLAIGPYGFSLHYGMGCRLLGYDSDIVKEEAVTAGLPVIDSRGLMFEDRYRLVVHGPLVAVGQEPDPPPYHALSYAPLRVVAAAWRAAGAEVLNLDEPAPESERADGGS